MSDDPYKVLGVSRTATDEELRKAYRQLAKKLHPDLNPGNKDAEDRFKEVTAAYDLLSDSEKRGRFDRGEIDASGAERARQRYYRDFAEGEAGRAYAGEGGFGGFEDADDIMAEIFGRAGRSSMQRRGADVRYRLELDFLEAVNGGDRSLTLPDGSALEVTIPPGTRDGQVLRLRGKGRPGIGGGLPGDALIELEVSPHPLFQRTADDIRVDQSVSLRVAVLGGQVNVPTTTGSVTMTIPPWSNTGKVLRLKGKGVARPDGTAGDQYVTLKLTLPAKPDPALQAFVEQWRPAEDEASRSSDGRR